MERIVYAIGDSSFEYIRRNGQFYVDKTSYVYDLVSGSKYYFLSRPRRFGKSLLVSTLEAYFSGKRELFEGLYIADKESKWLEYPVFHFDFSMGDMSSADKQRRSLDLKLSEWEKIYGRNEMETTFGLRFRGVIHRACGKIGRNVVILVDEYDNPLFSTFEDHKEHEEIRSTLRDIYSIFKSESAIIRFCFLTGITRFSKMSLFSGMNNLYDITLLPAYAGICGITQQELEEQCYAGVESVGEANGMTYDETMKVLNEQYDGYHFGDLKLDIYNPFSLIHAFASRKIGSYWFSRAMLDFLRKRLGNIGSIDVLQDTLTPIFDKAAPAEEIDGSLSTEEILFNIGCLTVKKDLGYHIYQLGVPNAEIKEGIMEVLAAGMKEKVLLN